MATDLHSMVEIEAGFSTNPIQAHQRLREWKSLDFSAFLQHCVQVLRRGEDSNFTQILLQLLREDGVSLQNVLFAQDLLNLDEAAKVVRLASKTDPGFQLQLVSTVKAEIDKAGSSVRSEDLARMLEILVYAVDATRLAPMLAKLCEHGDERIRSKAVLLAGRVSKKSPTGIELLRDQDPRVRANGVEAMWGRKDSDAIAFFAEAAKDSNHRVSANALLGLHMAGDTSCLMMISKMAAESELVKKLAGVWLVGQSGDSRYLSLIQEALAISAGRLKFAYLKAGRMIKKRREEVTSKGMLRLELVREERMAMGRVHLAFLAFDPEGKMLTPEDILGTNVVVYDGELRVDKFRWEASGAKVKLHAAFLIPLRTGVSENFATQLVSAMELGISGKRRNDHWSIQKYLPVETSAPKIYGPPANVEFSNAPDVLRADQLRAARGAARNLTEAAERLASMFPPEAENRHLVIVLDPDLNASLPVPASLAERCERFHVKPHVIACANLTDEAFASWDKFCAKLGGVFLECQSGAELPMTLRLVSLSLQSSFGITYQLGRITPTGTSEEPIRLEVYSDHGYGEITIGGDAMATADEMTCKANAI